MKLSEWILVIGAILVISSIVFIVHTSLFIPNEYEYKGYDKCELCKNETTEYLCFCKPQNEYITKPPIYTFSWIIIWGTGMFCLVVSRKLEKKEKKNE